MELTLFKYWIYSPNPPIYPTIDTQFWKHERFYIICIYIYNIYISPYDIAMNDLYKKIR